MDKRRPLSAFMKRTVEAFPRQVDLAEATGLEPATVSNYYTGKREPKGEYALKILRAVNKKTGVSIDQIIENHCDIAGTEFTFQSAANKKIKDGDIVFHRGKIGRYYKASSDNNYWTIIPLDGSKPDVFCEHPELKAVEAAE